MQEAVKASAVNWTLSFCLRSDCSEMVNHLEITQEREVQVMCEKILIKENFSIYCRRSRNQA